MNGVIKSHKIYELDKTINYSGTFQTKIKATLNVWSRKISQQMAVRNVEKWTQMHIYDLHKIK